MSQYFTPGGVNLNQQIPQKNRNQIEKEIYYHSENDKIEEEKVLKNLAEYFTRKIRDKLIIKDKD